MCRLIGRRRTCNLGEQDSVSICGTADFQCMRFIYFAFSLIPRPTGEISGLTAGHNETRCLCPQLPGLACDRWDT